uniref:Sodium/solute symporter n=1 Tax=Chromera velia CCMP2878 TaxID=1169474 RepID=A0A0G4H4F6_9ALVE|eukprot:Cvel_24596.t1-p1 / transcript=Cvel_24596.t1 / gene=Cvel_24596 / organism=Chromera_velia_CCMP2878 / gene_product=Sodium/proline symporter, putative / transcript_product=Sodium/proline symporter, putative / location=Cvel_scaffold2679:322-2755(+) / protein_length=747 / sequence_SO=supercontig / SO=protein_coding / is_pseudo=false
MASAFAPAEDDIGWGAWTIIALYLMSTLIAGFIAFQRSRKAKAQGQSGGLHQHFLAGGGLGVVVLAMTKLATVFSGYTLVGVPAEAYRTGFTSFRWLSGILFVAYISIIVAPRLQLLTKVRGYLSPTDFFADRYRSFFLHKLVSLTFLVPLACYTVAQFKAMGTTVEGISNGRISSFLGASALTVLLLLYESLGGLTAVALTDTVQGFLMLSGFALMLAYIQSHGGIGPVVENNAAHFATPLTVEGNMGFSLFSGAFLGSVLYPHWMMRTMASKNPQTTRFAILVLALSPFLCTLPACLLGVKAYEMFPDLDKNQSAAVFSLFVKKVMFEGPGWYLVGALLLATSIAAIMSTADSGLIVISLLVTVDFVKPLARPSDRALKIVSTTMSVCFACLSILLSELPGVSLAGLWGLQQELIMQIMPAFILGVFTKWAHAVPVTAGLCAGLALTAALTVRSFTEEGPVGRVYPGFWGIALNVLVLGATHIALQKRTQAMVADGGASLSSPNVISESTIGSEGETGAGGQSWADPLSVHSRGSVYGTDLKGSHMPSKLVGFRLGGERREPADYPLLMVSLLVLMGLSGFFFVGETDGSGLAEIRAGLPLFVLIFLIILSVACVGIIISALLLWNVSTHPYVLEKEAEESRQADTSTKRKEAAELGEGVMIAPEEGEGDQPLPPLPQGRTAAEVQHLMPQAHAPHTSLSEAFASASLVEDDGPPASSVDPHVIGNASTSRRRSPLPAGAVSQQR